MIPIGSPSGALVQRQRDRRLAGRVVDRGERREALLPLEVGGRIVVVPPTGEPADGARGHGQRRGEHRVQVLGRRAPAPPVQRPAEPGRRRTAGRRQRRRGRAGAGSAGAAGARGTGRPAPSPPTPPTPSRSAAPPPAGSARVTSSSSCPSDREQRARLLPRGADLGFDLARDRRVEVAADAQASRLALARVEEARRRPAAPARGRRAAAPRRRRGRRRRRGPSGPAGRAPTAASSRGRPARATPVPAWSSARPARTRWPGCGSSRRRRCPARPARSRPRPRPPHRRWTRRPAASCPTACGPGRRCRSRCSRAGPSSGVEVLPMLIVPARRSSVTTLSSQVGDEVGERGRAQLGRHAGDVVQVLDRGGDAVQRRQLVRLALEHQVRRLGGLGAGPLGGDRDERAELVVQAVDAVESVLDQLGGTHLAAADGRGRLERGQVVQVGHASAPYRRGSSAEAADEPGRGRH